MDEPKEKEKETVDTTKKGFFQFVFNFDEENKANIMNLVQFACLGFIPIVALNKSMQRYVPEADEQKSSIELLIEILIQIIVMFLGIYFIHRILIFIPTFSEVKYPDFNIIITVIPILLITLSLQTKLGEKVSILTDRIFEAWDGTGNNKKKKKNSNNSVTITQPLSNSSQPIVQNFVGSQGTTSISSLPTSGGSGGSQPNFDTFYSTGGGGGGGDNEDQFPILAANEVLGGSFGSGF